MTFVLSNYEPGIHHIQRLKEATAEKISESLLRENLNQPGLHTHGNAVMPARPWLVLERECAKYLHKLFQRCMPTYHFSLIHGDFHYGCYVIQSTLRESICLRIGGGDFSCD